MTNNEKQQQIKELSLEIQRFNKSLCELQMATPNNNKPFIGGQANARCKRASFELSQLLIDLRKAK
jgi:hypothetical protein